MRGDGAVAPKVLRVKWSGRYIYNTMAEMTWRGNWRVRCRGRGRYDVGGRGIRQTSRS